MSVCEPKRKRENFKQDSSNIDGACVGGNSEP